MVWGSEGIIYFIQFKSLNCN